MAIEPLELNKDNLALSSFLSILSNISETYNRLLENADITIDETQKLMSNTVEAYSFFEQIKNSSIETDISQVDILKTNLDAIILDIQIKIDNGTLKGAPFTFDDFTAEQKEELKGQAFTYDNFTTEQKEELKGASFVYNDFTVEQIANLKATEYNLLQNKPFIPLKVSELEDYEEGSFIATICGSEGGTSVDSSVCNYVKIGNKCTVNVSFDSFNATDFLGEYIIKNLPFESLVSSYFSLGMIYNIDFLGGLPLVRIVGSSVVFFSARDGGSWSSLFVDNSDDQYIKFSHTYIIK